MEKLVVIDENFGVRITDIVNSVDRIKVIRVGKSNGKPLLFLMNNYFRGHRTIDRGHRTEDRGQRTMKEDFLPLRYRKSYICRYNRLSKHWKVGELTGTVKDIFLRYTQKSFNLILFVKDSCSMKNSFSKAEHRRYLRFINKK